MKILIINKFLYPRGGDCICALNQGALLRLNGHEVKYFAMEYPHNLYFEESFFFPKEVSFSGSNISSKLKALTRVLNGSGVERQFVKLLNEFKPDIIHIHNIHSYLSPIVARIAYEKRIKVLWTMHDYKLICPSYICLNQGNICEACFDNNWSVVATKCMKGSLVASGLAWLEALKWNKKLLSKWTNYFICPSRFMADKMIKGGFAKDKLKILCNFLDNEKIELIQSIKDDIKEDAFCYIGRLSEEKGIKNLLEVASQLPYKLYIAGDGPLKEIMEKEYSSNTIEFLGHQDKTEIITLLKKVHFSIIPSIWYENNPLSVIESLCSGTPVLGSNMGGIPELLTDEYSEIYNGNDNKELKSKIELMFSKNIDSDALSKASIERFSADKYYENLMRIYCNE